MIQLSDKQISYERQIYSGIDVVSDIGGLLEGLLFFGKIIVALYELIMGDPVTAFLTGSIFKRKALEE